jgi:hypothetical protein
MLRYVLIALLIASFSKASLAEVGKQYQCTETNFVVGNNHNFTLQKTQQFSLVHDYSNIRISGGFLSGNVLQYTSLGPNKIIGSGPNFLFKYDNGYFVWTKISNVINEIYTITARCY